MMERVWSSRVWSSRVGRITCRCNPPCGSSLDELNPAAIELTRAAVGFGVPHAEVPHGTRGQAHPHLTDVVALQEDEEFGLALDTAVVLGAALAALGAHRQTLGADWGEGWGRGEVMGDRSPVLVIIITGWSSSSNTASE